MVEDDDLSKTMVIPNPGGRRNTSQQVEQVNRAKTAQSAFTQAQPESPILAINDVASLGENTVLTQARDIIALAGNVRTLSPANTIQQLRLDVENLFRLFDKAMKQNAMPDDVALTARYLLCCLVDELVLSTPWGIDSPWSHQTLLAKYHNETSGGEKFFLIVNKVMEHPQQNLDLIELCYVCLCLGFRGKYRRSPTGENDIVQISNMLYQAIALHRPVAADLSPNWQPLSAPPPSLEKRFPPTLMFMLLCFVCVAAYISFLSSLNAQSSLILAKIEQIAWDDLIAEAREKPSNLVSVDSIVKRLRISLQSSISLGQVDVVNQGNLVIVRLISKALFPPGSTRVNQQELPAAADLSRAILPFSNSLIIVGHTDSTGRTESNWTISRQRAEAVDAWLRSSSPSVKHTVTRGMADTQPMVNRSDASENRRVELILLLKDEV